MSKIKLSIVIPVYNGENDILRVLQSVSEQKCQSGSYEVIVVDNNSKDKTYEIASSFIGKINNYKIVKELNQGLSYARNRGYIESVGEYVGYVDDDAKLRDGYIERALKIIEDIKPDIFGGPIYPFYVTEKPDWFKDEYEIRIEKETSGFLTKENRLSGSNMVFKKDILVKYNGFNTKLGMSGDKLGYGEETQLIDKAYKDKKNVYYDIDLIVEHKVEDYKMHLAYFIVSSFYGGYTKCNTNQIFNLEEFTSMFKDVMGELNKYFIKNSKNNIENYILEKTEFNTLISKIGNLTALLENKKYNIQNYKTIYMILKEKIKKLKIYIFLKRLIKGK